MHHIFYSNLVLKIDNELRSDEVVFCIAVIRRLLTFDKRIAFTISNDSIDHSKARSSLYFCIR